MRKNNPWNLSLESRNWQWLAPALVSATSLGIYWAARRRLSNGGGALSLLKDDHDRIKALLADFDKATVPAAMTAIADQVIMELQIHTILEEELFYPAVRRETHDDEIVDLAEAEHQAVNALISDLQPMNADHPRYHLVFRALADQVREHMSEEEQDLFARVEGTSLDLRGLGRRMLQRKQELQRKMKFPAMLAS